MLELTWKRHKELIPQIPTLIDTLSKKTQDRRASIQSQLHAAFTELERDREGRMIKLRYITSCYLNEFLSTIYYSLESNFSAVFNVDDLLADYDLFGAPLPRSGFFEFVSLTRTIVPSSNR